MVTHALTAGSLMLITFIFTTSVAQEQCYDTDNSPYLYFSSKTSYVASRGSELKILQNCSPVYLWALIRHGTRYPNKKFIKSINTLTKLRDEIMENHEQRRGTLCDEDLTLLNKWSSNLTVNLYHQLTPRGIEDMKLLAHNYKNTFPDLLTSTPNDTFIFQSSEKQRAKDSAIAFTNELFGTNFNDTTGNNITENEMLLRFNQHCPEYIEKVENNPDTYKERELFKQSELMQQALSNISIRLGYEKPLPYESVELMYQMCAYENAWYINSKSAFCSAFSHEELKILEYVEDITDYYEKGYGTPFEEKMGCVLVRDMMTTLSDVAKNPEKKKATFYFSHAEMIYPATVKLGLNHDEESLKHNNYEQMGKRKWKPAFFNSFAANILAVLYQCPGSAKNESVVLFYQNERQVKPPKCTQNLCTLEELQENFKEVFDATQCNLKFCESSDGITVFFSINVLLICCFLPIMQIFS